MSDMVITRDATASKNHCEDYCIVERNLPLLGAMLGYGWEDYGFMLSTLL